MEAEAKINRTCCWEGESIWEIKIWLGVWEHNPQAIKFYESRGFVETGHHEFITGDVVDRDIIMEKNYNLNFLWFDFKSHIELFAYQFKVRYNDDVNF